MIKEVRLRNAQPIIVLSRTDNAFLAKLLELEVPEIFDGLIVIKNIVREPGRRRKLRSKVMMTELTLSELVLV